MHMFAIKNKVSAVALLYVCGLFLGLLSLVGCQDRTLSIDRPIIPVVANIQAKTSGAVLLNTPSNLATNTIWSYHRPVSNWDITKETVVFTSPIPFSISTSPNSFYHIESSSCSVATLACSIVYSFKTVVTPGTYAVSLGKAMQNNALYNLNYNVLFQVDTIPTHASVVVAYTPTNANPNYIQTTRTWHTTITNQTGETVRLTTNMGTPDAYASFDTAPCQQTQWAPNAVCSFATQLGVQNTTVGYGRSGTATVYNRWGQRVINSINFAFRGVTNPVIVVSVNNLSVTSPGIDIHTTTRPGVAYTGTVIYTNTNPDPMSMALHFTANIPVSGVYSVGVNNCNNITLASNQSCTVGIVVANTNTPSIYAQTLGLFTFQNLEQAQTGAYTTQESGLTVFTAFDPIASNDIVVTTSSNVSFAVSYPTILEAGVTTTMTVVFTNTDAIGTMHNFSYNSTPVSGVVISNGCNMVDLLPLQSCVVSFSITVSAAPSLVTQPMGNVTFNNKASTLITKNFSESIYVFVPTQPSIMVSSTFSQNPLLPNYYAVNNSGIATTGTVTYTNVSTSPYQIAYDFTVDLQSQDIFTITNNCAGLNLAPGQSCTVGVIVGNTPNFGAYSVSFGTMIYNNRISSFTQTVATQSQLYFVGNLSIIVSTPSQLSTQPNMPTTFYTTLSTGVITTAEVRFINQSGDPQQVLQNIVFSSQTHAPFTIINNGCSGTILSPNTYCSVVYAVNGIVTPNMYSQLLGALQGNGVLTTATYISTQAFYTNFIDTPVLLPSVVATLSTNASMPTYFFVTQASQTLSTVVLTYTNQSAGVQPMTNFTAYITPTTNITVVSNQCQSVTLNTVVMTGGTQFCTVQLALMANQYGQTMQSLGVAQYSMSGHAYSFTNTAVLYAVVSTPPEVTIGVSTQISQNAIAPTVLSTATNATTTTMYSIVFSNTSDDDKEIAKNFTYITQATTQYSIVGNTCMGQTLATNQSCTVTIQLTIPTQATVWALPLGYASFQDLNGLSFNTANQTGYIQFSGVLTFTIATYTGLAQTLPGTPFMIQNANQSLSSIATVVTLVYTNSSQEIAKNIGLSSAIYNSPWSIVSNTCTGNLAPQASCTVSVALNRLTTASQTNITLPGIFGFNSVNTMYSATNTTTVYARFIEPFVSYSIISTLSTVSSEPTYFATRSTAMTLNTSIIWFMNTSTEFTATNIVVLATISTQFTLQNNCTSSIAPGSSCAVIVSVIATNTTTTTLTQQVPNLQYSDLANSPILINSDTSFYIIYNNHWIMIKNSGTHTCGITNSHKLYCWGFNASGQLGIGTSGPGTNQSTPQLLTPMTDITNIALGGYHTCAINGSKQLYCWGSNGYGQLGLGATANQSTPQLLTSMTNIANIALGIYHTCAINSASQLYCWGYNFYGQLGIGTSGTGADNSMPQLLTPMTNIINLALGGYHTCAMNNLNQLYCWGYNQYGQLGLGTSGNGADQSTPRLLTPMTNITNIALGGYHTCAVNDSKQLYCWGYNYGGQLGIGTSGTGADKSTPQLLTPMTNITNIALGRGDSCTINSTKQLYCWGDGSNGQLGLGTSTNQFTPQLLTPMTNITNIALGDWHTCAINSANRLYCWGHNVNGQLGLGDTTNRSSPTLVPFIF
jgi:alpha-tubulin suppressor-like RCC1 family protein